MENFLNMKIGDIMHSRTWDLPLVEENADVKFVLIVLIGRCYTWVVKDIKSMELKGIITEHDAIKLLNGYNDKLKAKDLMSSKLIYARTDEKVKDIIKKINENGVRRIPVIENKMLIGEITLRYLIEKLYSAVFNK